MNSYFKLLSTIMDEGKESSPRNSNIKECIDVSLKINSPNPLVCIPGIRDVVDKTTREGKYLRAEYVWYMSGSSSPCFIGLFGSMWNTLINNFDKTSSENGNVNSNYGKRVFHLSPEHYIRFSPRSSYKWVVNELKKDRDSRKAIIQYTSPYIYFDGVNDFTCTQTQHFLIRNNVLSNIINIRSSDAIKGLTFDIPWWDFVGQSIAAELGASYEEMSVHIGSSHIYETDYNLVNRMLDNESTSKNRFLVLNKDDNNNRMTESIKIAIEIREYINKLSSNPEVSTYDKQKCEMFISNVSDIYTNNDSELIESIISLSKMLVSCVEIFPTIIDKNKISILNNKIFNLAFSII